MASLRPACQGRPSALRPIARRSTSAEIADQLRDAIAGGRFAPGDQVTEQGLAAELQVSRGPVREALQRLMQEGLLIGEPNRSVVVMSLSGTDVADLYVARLAVERQAALVLAGRSGDVLAPLGALVAKLDTAVRRHRWSEAAALDSAFHTALVEAAGSARLIRMFATLQVETRFCLAVLRSAHPPRTDLAAEHQVVLDAIRSGDVARIGAVLQDHMDAAVATLVGQPGPADPQPIKA
jgi:DNA-binding GntR family transcriptional regulator